MTRHFSHRERYEDVVLRTRPVFYAPLQGSKLHELVLGSNAGTVTAARVGELGPFPGAQGVRFDGAGDSVVFTTDPSFHPGDTFSVGGWFDLREAGGDTGGIMFTLNATNDLTVYFVKASGKLALRKSGVSDVFTTNRTFATPWTDRWQHLIFAKNGAVSVTCYLNGAAAAGTFTNATIVAGAGGPRLGLAASGSNDFNGYLSHWAVWNRLLTAAEASELYRAGRNAT
jgi:hypothetical protein